MGRGVSCVDIVFAIEEIWNAGGLLLNRLRQGASSADYERWVREVDYPTARALPPIASYVVAKMAATLDGQPAPYDYIERVEITDLDDYRAALADPSMATFAEGVVQPH